MNRLTIPVACLAAGLALSGCAKTESPAPEASESAATGMPVSDESAMSGLDESTAAADASDAPSASPAAATGEIPAGMRGRFGLVPADCTTARGDDKGLITVGADSLKFYESIAKLGKVQQSSADHLKATFAYSGEGMEWSRDATLDLKNGGKTLVLEEFGDDAIKGPRTYTRCE